jgi:hypothetical protein
MLKIPQIPEDLIERLLRPVCKQVLVFGHAGVRCLLRNAYAAGYAAGQQNERDQGPAKSFAELAERRARQEPLCARCGGEIPWAEAAAADDGGVYHERCYQADPKRGLPQRKGQIGQ